MAISSFIKDMMMARQISMSKGRTEILGFRMAFLPVHTLTALIEELYQREGNDAFDMLFEMGKAHGHFAIEELGKKHGIPKREFLEETLTSANVLGLGEFRLEKFNYDKKRFTLTIHDSPLAQEFSESEILADVDIPIDHIQRGMTHAVADELFDGPISSRETRCSFHGDNYCQFEITADPDEGQGG
jgi:predicted hydrocarbon binding protein